MPLAYHPVVWTRDELDRELGGAWVAGAESRWAARGLAYLPVDVKPGDLFFARANAVLPGELTRAFASGAVAAVVASPVRPAACPGPVMVVPNAHVALRALADAARKRTEAKLVAVTGVAGKTGMKSALATVLAEHAPTHATPGSGNAGWYLIGSLAQLPRACGFGVFELGMRRPESIAPLSTRVRPHVAVITTLGSAHLSFHGSSTASVAQTKAGIVEGLEPGGVAVFPRDGDDTDVLRRRAEARGVRVVWFGRHAEADVRLLDAQLGPQGSEVQIDLLGRRIGFDVSMPGTHWVSNSLAILGVADALGLDVEAAADALSRLEPVGRRGSRLRCDVDGRVLEVVDDSYNANPQSMRASLEVLGLMQPALGARRVALLGEMRELGDASKRLHAELADVVMRHAIDLVCTVGPDMRALQDALPAALRGPHADDAAGLASEVRALVRHGDVVLVKGSNGSRMDLVVKALAGVERTPAAKGWSVANELKKRAKRASSSH